MTLSADRFAEFYEAIYHRPPFPWQSRLALKLAANEWPDCIDLPTASGKTTVIDIAVFTLACQASRSPSERTIGRRIFFAVNRRVIVDEAYQQAHDLAERLLEAERDKDQLIVGEVARALRSLNEHEKLGRTPPLDVAQLRGGVYRDSSWARSLTQPMVVCTTVDQFGSRLLFRGYGVSNRMKPVHAALCGCDSVVLLDEAHVTKAFSQTMQLIPRYQEREKRKFIPGLRFVQMTATPTEGINQPFILAADDLEHPVLRQRQNATKPAELVMLDKKASVAGEIAKRAKLALDGPPRAIGIIVNRVQTARDIYADILAALPKPTEGDTAKADVHLVIGRMRPIDRDDLQKALRATIGPERDRANQPLDKPVVVVATQCLEVGADYDFDVLLTECASIDALRQRFGRLNRKGRPINAIAAIVASDESLKGTDPIYGDAIKHTWEWLTSHTSEDRSVDFGIAAFRTLWQEVEREHKTYLDRDCLKPLLAPAPDAAVLLPAHLDALCQTAPLPLPSPDVSFFIHGPRRDNAEVNVCWRADLDDDEDLWPDIVRLLPPTTPECMTVPLTALRRWMGQNYKAAADADVPTNVAEEAPEKVKRPNDKTTPNQIHAVIWRGRKDVSVAISPGDVRPNDTIVIRTQDFGWDVLGHIPGAPVPAERDRRAGEPAGDYARRIHDANRDRDAVDQAEQAKRQASRRIVIRRHPALGRGLTAGESGRDNREDVDAWLKQLPEIEAAKFVGGNNRWELRPYPSPEGGRPAGEIIQFIAPLERDDKGDLELPSEEDDGVDDSTGAAGPIPLSVHTANVVAQFELAIPKLRPSDEEVIRLGVRLHDIGKSDLRFNALLRRCTPAEVTERGVVLGKSDGQDLTRAEFRLACDRAMFPRGFNHEVFSAELIANGVVAIEEGMNRELLLHVVASHHGLARPFVPVVYDDRTEDEQRRGNTANFHDRRSVSLPQSDYWDEIEVPGDRREEEAGWVPAHRLDSGVADRFWKLVQTHGWWGLTWTEAILRLADQQASANEREGESNEE